MSKRKIINTKPRAFRIRNEKLDDLVENLEHGKFTEIMNEMLEEYFKDKL